jgi:hypothetical protein
MLSTSFPGDLRAQVPCPAVDTLATGLVAPSKIIQTPRGDFIVAEGGLQVPNNGRVSIVDCRRWKATRTGVEPLREAQALAEKRDAQGVIYIVGGELTDKARAFAGANNIRVIKDAELTELVG